MYKKLRFYVHAINKDDSTQLIRLLVGKIAGFQFAQRGHADKWFDNRRGGRKITNIAI